MAMPPPQKDSEGKSGRRTWMGHELPARWLRWELPSSQAGPDKGLAEGVASSPSHGRHCVCWRGSSGSSPHGLHGETEAQGVESTVHGCATPGPTSPDLLWLGEMGVGLCHFLFCQVTLWGGWLGASVRVDV